MDQKLLRIYQLQDGYCYNSDSLFLYAFARNFLRKKFSLLDVGAGSGILGLLCARDFAISATLVEKDAHNAFLAQQNAATNQLEAEVYQGDFLDFCSSERYDVILSNPPFYRSEILDSQNKRIQTARNARFLPFEALCKKAKQLLSPKGNFIFCYDAKESHHIFQTLQNCGFNAEICRFVYPRIDKNASLLLLQAKIHTKNSLKILPPLITHNSTRQIDHTKEVGEIYALCRTHSIKVYASDITEVAHPKITKIPQANP
ncbi:tRNA1(Val) (adenine(37)-N6)-methyltransferase [Helicobacter mustelae]|uniref:Methyltransferase small domain-containing protein n=1 Tax=Helicobacter mustelae (strain ATCC 43772 / CCUG 25715 / CIP 103759 / LMG 18044 / NCTC 12198 / R85-136P) TaxID=679897 RepID=D3UHB5_HELM1|nr:methyltransferase [Helicobacter mustelae]CBG39887.1 Putative hypothetical protein [Helicobacter mustelae 12198]SQH71397.1 putative SAM-dependent methyltransferase [Helicobacter mustelae]